MCVCLSFAVMEYVNLLIGRVGGFPVLAGVSCVIFRYEYIGQSLTKEKCHYYIYKGTTIILDYWLIGVTGSVRLYSYKTLRGRRGLSTNEKVVTVPVRTVTV